ncbi:TPA: hypothetical protein ACU1Q3_000816 [Salmonella enterica]
MSKKFFSIIMVISFVAAITACQSSIPEYVRSTLNGHSIQDVLVYMKGLPLDKRYDFYYYGTRAKRPYPLWMADGIAPMGSKAIPLLRDKLSTTNSSFEKMTIIYLLSVMSVHGCYDVKSDSELFSLVMQKECELNDDNYHDYITNMNDFYEFGSSLNSTERIKCE